MPSSHDWSCDQASRHIYIETLGSGCTKVDYQYDIVDFGAVCWTRLERTFAFGRGTNVCLQRLFNLWSGLWQRFIGPTSPR